MRPALLLAAVVLVLPACGSPTTGDSQPATPGTPFTLPDGTRCVGFADGSGQCAFSSPTEATP